MDNKKITKAYKGFNADMTCNPNGKPFQYAEGETYKEESCELCSSGFHACERPLDVFNYYTPAKSVYHAVEMDGVSDKREGDTKICGTEIHIGARLNIANLVKAQFDYVRSRCTNESNAEAGEPATAGDSGAATAGYGGAATAGNRGAATARGSATVGENGVGTVRGNDVKIRGGIGALLVAAEESTSNYDIVSWATAIVDGEKIKPDTWYCVKDGKFVAVGADA